MSQTGHLRTFDDVRLKSPLIAKADSLQTLRDVSSVPKPEVVGLIRRHSPPMVFAARHVYESMSDHCRGCRLLLLGKRKEVGSELATEVAGKAHKKWPSALPMTIATSTRNQSCRYNGRARVRSTGSVVPLDSCQSVRRRNAPSDARGNGPAASASLLFHLRSRANTATCVSHRTLQRYPAQCNRA